MSLYDIETTLSEAEIEKAIELYESIQKLEKWARKNRLRAIYLTIKKLGAFASARSKNHGKPVDLRSYQPSAVDAVIELAREVQS